MDGVALDEPYIKEATHIMYDVVFPVTVPENHFFVMGDNEPEHGQPLFRGRHG